MKKIFEEMFKDIGQVIPLDEIAYLGIQEGELIPIYKNDTEDLSMNEWIKFHTEYRSFVKDAPFLMALVEKKTKALIRDTNQLPKKPVEFEALNICSIYLFPIVYKDSVVGILDIAYRNTPCDLTDAQIEKIEQIASTYVDNLGTLK